MLHVYFNLRKKTDSEGIGSSPDDHHPRIQKDQNDGSRRCAYLIQAKTKARQKWFIFLPSQKKKVVCLLLCHLKIDGQFHVIAQGWCITSDTKFKSVNGSSKF